VKSSARRRAGAFIALTLTAGIGLMSSPSAAAECPDQLPSCIVVSVVKTVDGGTTVLN
jgi:hypothetical protein